MNVFIDIETLQTQDPDTIAVLTQAATAPANLVDPVKIIAAKEKALNKALEATALDGTYGTICCICWDAGNDIQTVDVLSCGSEYSMLYKFFDIAKSELTGPGGLRQPWFIGHNVSFDLRFLWRRAMIHDIKIPFKIPHNAAPWNNKYTCTMHEWCGAKEYIKLKELCRVLGIDSKDDIDGKDVGKMWKENPHAVLEHCRMDVKRLRMIHQRITTQ